MGWVKLHPHNIAQKVHIIVEHFRQFVWPLLDGMAKAMVVVGSWKEAVRWKLAIDKSNRDKGYPPSARPWPSAVRSRTVRAALNSSQNEAAALTLA